MLLLDPMKIDLKTQLRQAMDILKRTLFKVLLVNILPRWKSNAKNILDTLFNIFAMIAIKRAIMKLYNALNVINNIKFSIDIK